MVKIGEARRLSILEHIQFMGMKELQGSTFDYPQQLITGKGRRVRMCWRKTTEYRNTERRGRVQRTDAANSARESISYEDDKNLWPNKQRVTRCPVFCNCNILSHPAGRYFVSRVRATFCINDLLFWGFFVQYCVNFLLFKKSVSVTVLLLLLLFTILCEN